MTNPRFSWILLMCALLFCATVSHGFKRIDVGGDAWDFTLEDLDGNAVTLSENLGEKATLLIFWASWSPRSADLLDDMQKLFAEQAANGLSVVGVNVEHPEWDPNELEKIRAATEEASVTFPMVLDKDLTSFNDYGVIAVPSSALLDPTGTVLAILQGYPNMLRTEFREKILIAIGVMDPPKTEAAEAPKEYIPKGKAVRYLKMAEVMLRKKKPKRALAMVDKAISQDPEYGSAHELKAKILDELGRPEAAEVAREKARDFAFEPAIESTAPTEDEPQAAGMKPDDEAAPTAEADEESGSADKADKQSTPHQARQSLTAPPLDEPQ